MNVYRSAVSSTHLPVDGFPLGQHPLVSKLLRGVFNSRSPQPRYSDVSKVLDYLSSLREDPLPISLLTKKLAMLLALVSAQRSSDLVRLSLPVSNTTSRISVPLTGLAKQTQPGNTRAMKPLYIAEFKQNPLLCPVRCLREYVTRTQAWRDNQSRLFLALMAPHKPVVSSSIARWLKDVLHQSGVDISCFTAHSTRGASA